MRLAPVFEQLLAGWKAQGWRLVSMRTLLDTLQPLALPRCEVGPGTVDGRSGTVLLQRDEFLADVDLGQTLRSAREREALRRSPGTVEASRTIPLDKSAASLQPFVRHAVRRGVRAARPLWWWRGSAFYPWAFALSALVLLVTLGKPDWLAPANRAWMKLAEILHRIVSPIALGIMFFGVLTPDGARDAPHRPRRDEAPIRPAGRPPTGSNAELRPGPIPSGLPNQF